MRTPRLSGLTLPPEALPFVREFLLEVTRRLPHALGAPPRLEADHLREPQRCVDAAQALIHWLDTVPETLDQRMEELETVFASLLEVVRQLDTRVHRAVRQARRWVEEDMTFSRTVQEVFEELKGRVEMGSTPEPAREVIIQMIHRIEAKERADHAEAMALSTQFNAVQTDLDRLRNQIARVEKRAQELRNESLRDGLTGLWNRRAYDGRIAEEVTRAVRYKSPLSIALFDIDRFKALNDAHGHRVGDAVLHALAGRILRMLRQSDFLARYGGEEFAVIFPNTELSKAAVAGEKIRSATRGETIPTSAGPLRVTVSIGVASLAPRGTPEALFEDADRALYRAKAAGRDRVEAAEIQTFQTPDLSVELGHPSQQGDDEQGPEEDDPQRDGPLGEVVAPLAPQSLDGGSKARNP